MSDPNRPADSRRVPGWERVLDAFMSAPDRALTNVQLGRVPGVQAFHQRISDLERYGYVLTGAVKLKPGHYAYKLLGVDPSLPTPRGRARPHAGALTELTGTAIDLARNEGVAWIVSHIDVLLRRAEPVRPAPGFAETSRASRDAAACLATALGDDVIGDWPDADRADVLALARAARDEIDRSRSLRALEQAHGLLRDEVREVVFSLREALGDHVADWTPQDRSDVLKLTGKACGVLGGLREALAARPARAPRAPRQPRAERGPTGPDLMRKALEHCEQPMHSAKIAEWVMSNGGADIYKGATPHATMAAQLATSNVRGGDFLKVAPGCYGLREWACSLPDEEPRAARRDEFGNPLLELDPIR